LVLIRKIRVILFPGNKIFPSLCYNWHHKMKTEKLKTEKLKGPCGRPPSDGVKIAQQFQCCVRDASRTVRFHRISARQAAWPYSTEGRKECSAVPGGTFMNGVRLPLAVNCWAIFEKSVMTQRNVTDIKACAKKSNGLCNARFSKINVQ
jgi:hypothetical protein